MITLNSTLFSILIIYGSATSVHGGELLEDRVQSLKAISDVVEANCSDQEDTERLHFLKEVYGKLELQLNQVTNELRNDERLLVEPRKHYLRSLALKADQASQKATEFEGTIHGLWFEHNIEKDAATLYSDSPNMEGEVKRHEQRQAYFASEISKTHRTIASLKEAAKASRQEYEKFSAAPETLAQKNREIEIMTDATRAKLPAIRDLAAKYRHLDARMRYCISKADAFFERGRRIDRKHLELDEKVAFGQLEVSAAPQ